MLQTQFLFSANNIHVWIKFPSFTCLVFLLKQNAMTKNNLGRRGFILLILSDHSLSLITFRAGTQAGAEEGTTEECCCLLARFHLPVLSQLSHTTQDHLARGGSAHRCHWEKLTWKWWSTFLLTDSWNIFLQSLESTYKYR